MSDEQRVAYETEFKKIGRTANYNAAFQGGRAKRWRRSHWGFGGLALVLGLVAGGTGIFQAFGAVVVGSIALGGTIAGGIDAYNHYDDQARTAAKAAADFDSVARDARTYRTTELSNRDAEAASHRLTELTAPESASYHPGRCRRGELAARCAGMLSRTPRATPRAFFLGARCALLH